MLSDSYNIYRRDRNSTVVAKNKMCHDGGALVAMSSTYCSKHRLDQETDLEILWTQTRLAGHNLYLGCVYVPTWSDVDTWSELDKSPELVYNAMNPDCNYVLLCDDFNRQDIEWTPANNTIGLMPHSWTTPQSELCVEMCEYGLVQCSKDPTCSEHILDLVCVHAGHCNVQKTEKAVKSTHGTLHYELLCARPTTAGTCGMYCIQLSQSRFYIPKTFIAL